MSKKTKTGREVLEEALLISCSDYYDQFPSYEGEIDPGEEYEKAMNALIRRSKKPKPRYFNTLSKRVAGIAAALLIVFGCSMTVSAVRLPFVEFLSNTYDKYVEIFFDSSDVEKAPSVIETVYTLGYVPEGYILEKSYVGNTGVSMAWLNGNGDRIAFSQGILKGSSILDTENSDYTIVEWNEYQIAISEKSEKKVFLWNTDEYHFSLTLCEDISNEEAFIIINSIIKYENL